MKTWLKIRVPLAECGSVYSERRLLQNAGWPPQIGGDGRKGRWGWGALCRGVAGVAWGGDTAPAALCFQRA